MIILFVVVVVDGDSCYLVDCCYSLLLVLHSVIDTFYLPPIVGGLFRDPDLLLLGG